MSQRLNEDRKRIVVCSDSAGETAETVVRATLRQFEAESVQVERWANVKSEEEVRELMEHAASIGSFVVYTLVLPELREMIRQESARLGVCAVDVMGPVMEGFVRTFNSAPKQEAGRPHRMDEEYFTRVEAVEFTVKSDDGQHVVGWKDADLILLGVSRTSKTPLGIYLAHKGYKVANYPLVPEVKPPEELFRMPGSRFVGLTMQPEKLISIRIERLKSMGLPAGVSYARLERVAEELEYAQELFRRLGCLVVDVTDRAIEETAGVILDARKHLLG
ncbi:pyruvate, water dikinase regulatory protein [Paenibacillus pasadenensis]|uniref:pyruvate, water dikinase regulatory protein n=1 Tax=Paenibacillus TaxID=44249 RepID=UPI0004263597|nr:MULTISPECIES: pyruvate, water dikinase regulatory protein [Paenibacillus]QGG58013.1 pyruvate, phosphate dikinase/phosphoenolpyruvate synthase regulator [Paenibacillus sp. B01]